MKIIFKLLYLSILANFVNSERFTPYLTRTPFLKYDEEFVNVRVNFSGIEKSNIDNPIALIPSFKIKLLKGIQKVALSIKLTIVDRNITFFEKTVSFCPSKTKTSNFMMVYVTAIREMAGLQFRCKMAANETVRTKAVNLKNGGLTFLLKKQTYEEHATEAVVFEQKSPRHVIARLIVYTAKLKVE